MVSALTCTHLRSEHSAPAALGPGAFPRGREGEDSSTGGRPGRVLQIKTVCTSVLEKTLPKHLWADFCAVKGSGILQGMKAHVFDGGDGSVQVKARARAGSAASFCFCAVLMKQMERATPLSIARAD